MVTCPLSHPLPHLPHSWRWRGHFPACPASSPWSYWWCPITYLPHSWHWRGHFPACPASSPWSYWWRPIAYLPHSWHWRGHFPACPASSPWSYWWRPIAYLPHSWHWRGHFPACPASFPWSYWWRPEPSGSQPATSWCLSRYRSAPTTNKQTKQINKQHGCYLQISLSFISYHVAFFISIRHTLSDILMHPNVF